jgi:hypothetical protein
VLEDVELHGVGPRWKPNYIIRGLAESKVLL